MGSFEAHMKYGFASHFVSGVILIGLVYLTPLPLLAALIGVLAIPITLAGASFPDIDHPQSKPNRVFRQFLFGAGILVTAWVFGQTGFYEAQSQLQSAGTEEAAFSLAAVLTVIVALLGGFGVRFLFDILRPSHRGTTHRVPIGAGVSVGLGMITWALAVTVEVAFPLLLAGVVGWLFMAGFMSHLACDGVLLQARTYTRLR